MPPSGVNDSGREVMASVKKWYVDAEWRRLEYAFVRQSDNSFIVSVTATDVFTAGRRLRLIDGGVTIFGDVIASGLSGANTLVTVSSSALSASLSSGSVAIINPAQTSLPFMNALTSTASVTASDYLEIWQSGTGVRRRALQTNVVRGAGLVLVNEVNLSTGATSYTLGSNLPSWVKRITVSLYGFSTSGTSPLMLQLGDSGGLETSGYNGNSTNAAGTGGAQFSAGFRAQQQPAAAGTLLTAIFELRLVNSSTNVWSCHFHIAREDALGLDHGTGSKALSGTLTQIAITTVGGTDTGDAGAASILYEG